MRITTRSDSKKISKKKKEKSLNVSDILNCLSISYIPETIKRRDYEINFLSEFVEKCIEKRKSSNLLIIGPPGTGKTAILKRQLINIGNKNLKTIFLNAMQYENPSMIYKDIHSKIFNREIIKTKDIITDLEEHFKKSKKKMIVLAVDEIDYFIENDTNVLENLFLWSSEKSNSNLIVIGVSNTPNIQQRSKTLTKNKPTEILLFEPYKEADLLEILNQRMGETQILCPIALKMLAKKVSSNSGSIRQALQVLRKVMKSSLDTSKRVRIGNNPSEYIIGLQSIKVAMGEMSADNETVKRMRDLPTHQKIVLFAVFKYFENSKPDFTRKKFCSYYKKDLKRMAVPKLEGNSISKVLESLKSTGFVRFNNNNSSKLDLCVCIDDLKTAFEDDKAFNKFL